MRMLRVYSMVNNASTGGTKCAGKVHEMEEKT